MVEVPSHTVVVAPSIVQPGRQFAVAIHLSLLLVNAQPTGKRALPDRVCQGCDDRRELVVCIAVNGSGARKRPHSEVRNAHGRATK